MGSNNQIQFDFTASRIATNAGIQQAIDHANQVEESWGDRAYAILLSFIKTHPEFMAEDCRKYAENIGLPIPPDKRAWGAVIRRAVIAGLLFRIRYDNVKSIKGHMGLCAVWGVVK